MRAPHNQIRPDALREQRINPEDHGASVRIVSEMMRFPLLTSGSVVSPKPGQALVRFLPEWTGPTTTITPGDYHHAGRLRQRDSEAVECYAQHAQYDRATGL